MPVISMKPILDAADSYCYGQGAFNVNSVSQIRAAIEIHELLHSPAIIQGAELANGFMGGRVDFKNSSLEDIRRGAKNIGDAVWKYGEYSKVPIALHLDHGSSLDVVKACIDGGYTSVMIDGSALGFEDNMELTREAVRFAHARGVSVEGELGILAGVEDHVHSGSSTYTNPISALEFVQKTGVDALAISYGTMHGPVKGKDVKLRKEVVIAIRELFRHSGVSASLVSHGSSTVPRYILEDLKNLGCSLSSAEGIPISEIKEAIRAGISKINVDTDIRLAVSRNLREFFSEGRRRSSASLGGVLGSLEEKKDQIDPRQFLSTVMDSVMTGMESDGDISDLNNEIGNGVKEILAQLIVEFGSAGRASLVRMKSLSEMASVY